MNLVETLGEPPIPKIIHQLRKAEPSDKERFQTIFAEHTGAVIAPSAGLHFTKQLVKRLEIKGVNVCPITLHVSLGSFKSVDVEDLTKYKADSEFFSVSETTSLKVNEAKEMKKKVCAVGITTAKALESSVSANGRLKANEGWSDKFIFSPYEFKIPNALLTNFHLPETTLLMTTSAFGGFELIKQAYQTAIKEKYRFFSYGDAMLIID